MNASFRGNLKISAHDLNVAIDDYLGLYVSHGVLSLSLVCSDIEEDEDEAFATSDPAVWSDWLESIWRARGVRAVDEIHDGQVGFIHKGGESGYARIRRMRSSTFEMASESLRELICDGAFTELSAFVILTAFVNWDMWSPDWSIEDARIFLRELRSRSAPEADLERWTGLLAP